jgi:hypothetical protein
MDDHAGPAAAVHPHQGSRRRASAFGCLCHGAGSQPTRPGQTRDEQARVRSVWHLDRTKIRIDGHDYGGMMARCVRDPQWQDPSMWRMVVRGLHYYYRAGFLFSIMEARWNLKAQGSLYSPVWR